LPHCGEISCALSEAGQSQFYWSYPSSSRNAD